MLEFVNVSGPTGSKDLQTRRKVRSQAMRDFRRRQREERDALKANKTRMPSPSHSERERAASTGSESTKPSSRAQSARGPSPKPIHLKSQKAGERTFQAQQKEPQRHSTPHIQFETSNQDAFSQWQYDLGPMTSQSDPNSPYWQYSSRDPSPSRLLEPSMWGTETEDPFESPAQLQQMLAFCRSYIHWLRPGVKTETAGRIIGQAWETRPCPMLLAACCLASVGHLDAVQPNRPGGNYEVYKARVLRDVSRRMKSSTTALSDETLGALACLLSFEMSRGSGEALTHLYGLKSLLRAKGGIEALQAGALANMLQTLDLLHAILFECLPVLTNAIEDLRMTASPEDIDQDPDRLPKPLTTILHEHDNFMQTGPAAYVEALKSLRVLRREVGLVLRDELDSTANGTSPRSAHETSGNIERYRNALEGFVQGDCVESTEPEAFHFGRCNYFLALIHFNLIVKKVPYRHWSNQPHVEALFDAYQRVKHRTWDALPYLKLTCLCTAAAATTNARIKSFFKAELVRSIYLMGVEEMPRVENFLLRFIKTRDILQRPERLASPSISGGHDKNHSDPEFEQGDYFGGQSEYPATTLPLDGYSDWSTAPPAVSYVVSAPLESSSTSWDEEGHGGGYGEHTTPM